MRVNCRERERETDRPHGSDTADGRTILLNDILHLFIEFIYACIQ